MLEYWGGHSQEFAFPKCVKFEHKVDTDLYEFVRVSVQVYIRKYKCTI